MNEGKFCADCGHTAHPGQVCGHRLSIFESGPGFPKRCDCETPACSPQESTCSGVESAGETTRFAEFDDPGHPFRVWWEEHGQYMMAGGGARDRIWAARGWIAREQLAEGVEVTGDSMNEERPPAAGERGFDDATEERWQQAIYKLCKRFYPEVDGGGCDSGDLLDLTLAEIRMTIERVRESQPIRRTP